jgi:hypothetical protein
MKKQGHIYLRINKDYTATIRNLESLPDYLDSLTLDDTFGEITEVMNVSREFLNQVRTIVRNKKKEMNQPLIGQKIYLNRNQGYRDGIIVAVDGDEILVEYTMPKGTSSLNLIKDIYNTDKYKTITYSKALEQFEIDMNLLINNPQR